MPPISVLIKPASSSCNMTCKYCFYDDISNKRECKSYGTMKKEILETIIKKAFLQAEGHCSFAFQGGEPTLAGLKFYHDFIDFVQKYNTHYLPVYYSIQTNGILIDDKWSRFFKENNFLVGLSMDGDWRTHDENRIYPNGQGTFQDVNKSIKYLNRHHVEYNILCVITNKTAKKIEDIYLFYKQKGLRYLQFIPCLDPLDDDRGHQSYSLTPNDYSEFLKRLFDCWYNDFMNNSYISIRQFDNWINMLMGKPPENCGLRGTCSCYYVIEADGSVYPCDFYVLDQYRLGNILNDDFINLLKQSIAHHFVNDSSLLTDDCKECRFHFICRGGCKRDRIENYTKNYYCDALYSFFDYALERMQAIANLLKQNQIPQ